MEQSKNKKTMLTIIGVAILVIGLIGVTYAFFNYTRTGTRNIIKTGRIYFNSEQDTSINLTNMFPIDVSSGIPNDNTKVGTITINVVGDTTYDEGIEYLVSAVNVNNSVGNKTLPISIDVSVTNNSTNDPATTLGTSDDSYYTNRGGNSSIYKVLANETINTNDQLLVGYITKGATGIDGNIVIKAYLDKSKIAITDTYDGEESDNMGTTNEWVNDRVVFTTQEWNSLQENGVSFQIKVEANEGVWVNEIRTLYGIMRNASVMDNVASTYVSASTGIDFGAVSSDTNGKGVYERAGTENDEYPVYYYRGAVEDNNVLFANKCWKVVRTTDTGGVKLIYNGEYKEITKVINYGREYYSNDMTNAGAQFVFDSSNNEWHATGSIDTTFSISVPGTYILNYTAPTNGPFSLKKNDVLISSSNGTTSVTLENVVESDVFNISYYPMANGSQDTYFSLFKEGPIIVGMGCNDTGENANISVEVDGIQKNTFLFNNHENISDDSPARLGYMYGTIYEWTRLAATSGAYYGTSFEYGDFNHNGTSEYRLLSGTTSTTLDATHHYSCDLTDENGTCTEIRYYYSKGGSISLTGGDGIEEALAKMQTNTNDSNAKKIIDTWYENNINNYTNKLEDTIWCNDRSIVDLGGWNPNGGDLTKNFIFATRQRSNYALNESSIKNQPSLICANRNDSFTVSSSNGNGALTYPVAMLTVDEMVFAGGVANIVSTFYLNNRSKYWSMSPFTSSFPNWFEIDNSLIQFSDSSVGIRPSVSLKPGTLVASGTGTVLDPYVIE